MAQAMSEFRHRALQCHGSVAPPTRSVRSSLLTGVVHCDGECGEQQRELALPRRVDADTASDAANYTVTVNGQSVTAESAGYNASNHTVSLGLAEGALHNGDAITVSWTGLQDSAGQAVTGSATVK